MKHSVLIFRQQPAPPQFCLGGFDSVLGRPLAVGFVAPVNLLAERLGILRRADQSRHLLSGARLVLTAVSQLQRSGGRLAVATMCIGFGQGVATVFERS